MKLFGFDVSIKRGSSIEDPKTPISSSQIESLFVGPETMSGPRVNEHSALTFSAVWACVRILSESLGSLPLMVYRRTEDGGKEVATDHPVYRLLHDAPNENMSSMVWREAMQGHLCTHGNGYSYVRFSRGGRVEEIFPLLPEETTPTWVNGRLMYKHVNSESLIDSQNILHVPALGYNGLVGYSPIRMQREAIGLGLAAQQFGSGFFGNSAIPKGVLEHPSVLKDDAAKRLKTSWQAAYGGVGNSNKTAVLEEGLTYKPITIPPEDAQFLETRKFQITDIARIFRIPPHMLADLEKATFSNIEQQSIDFVVHTLRPWLVRWEQELNRKLFTTAEQALYFAEFKIDALLRGDQKARYESYSLGRNGGWLSVNDIRGFENQNPIAGGDRYLEPLNMQPISEGGDGEDDDDDSRAYSLELSIATHIAKREQKMLQQAIANRSAEDLDIWLESFFDGQVDQISTLLCVPEQQARAAVDVARQALLSEPTVLQRWTEFRPGQIVSTVRLNHEETTED